MNNFNNFNQPRRIQRNSGLQRSVSNGIIPPTPMRSIRKKSRRFSLSSSTLSTHIEQNSDSNVMQMETENNTQWKNLFMSSLHPLYIHFVNQGLIGRGSFSLVYKVKKSTTNKVYALKRSINKIQWISKPNSTYLQANASCFSEVAILNKLQKDGYSPNICKFRLYFVLQDYLHLIFELFPHGNFKQFIQCQDGRFNSLQILQVAIQLLDGLCYIHKLNIVHCDMKPENIFIEAAHKDRYLLKIGDFGIATDLDRNIGQTEQGKKIKLSSGDPIYIAPEVLGKIDSVHRLDENLKKIDVFSLGIIMIELLFDIKLPSGGDLFNALRNIGTYSYPNIDWKWFTKHSNQCNQHDMIEMKLKFLTSNMIYKDPNIRKSSAELVQFINMNWDETAKRLSSFSFSKLKLPSNIETKCNWIDHPKIFSCHKTEVNKVPIKQKEVNLFTNTLDFEMKSDEIIKDDTIKTLNFS